MAEHYPDLRPLYVYLTPDGDDPSDESWLPYTYTDIHRVFQRIRNTYESSIGDDVLVFVDHYLSLLGNRFMHDEELDELCHRIYKNHRQALDLIWERGAPESAPFVELTNLLERDARWHVLYSTNTNVDFVPKNWLK